MDMRHIALVVQGLFEKSDSIGYDAVFQYNLLREIYGANRVRIFSDRFDSELYPSIEIYHFSELFNYIDDNPGATIVYHYCDGWPELDEYIFSSRQTFIIRWHNNTPPWFYGASHRRSVERTIRGFRTIVDFLRKDNVRFWVNSNFTLEQLRALGAAIDRCSVVFPGSRFLESSGSQAEVPNQTTSVYDLAPNQRPLRLLFVSRVVAHKGHRHIIAFAAYLQACLGRDVTVTFVGRDDPSSNLRTELDELARRHSVELILQGEVSAGELRNAYCSADVFVCFSEHEGFGMPIFEAMRMGIPVVCWGKTALRELMQSHPFCLEDLDFAKASSIIKLLDDTAIKQEILVIQSEILKTYTSEIVAKQLVEALSEHHGFWSMAGMAEPKMAALAIKAQLTPALLPTDGIDLRFEHMVRDFGDNYVTLYDVESYEALLQADKGLDRLPEQATPTDFVLFSYEEFAVPHGKRCEAGVAFSGDSELKQSHSVYGPYTRFVRGYFSAEFLIEAELNGDHETELELDVHADGVGVLVHRRVNAAILASGEPIQLLFPISSDHVVIEFRVKVVKSGNCNFHFQGVVVRNMRQSVERLSRIEGKRRSNLPWWRKLWSREAVDISPSALIFFRRADELRDRAWWNDAAELYNKGLKIEPRAFDYLVQLGNCLKEAGRFDEGEVVYSQALSLRPYDRDLHLQLARLYLLTGNTEGGYKHLLSAVRPERASVDALRELAALGFDIGALGEMFE